MAATKKTVRDLPRNVWIVTLTSFLTDISSEMIFNLLPLFLANVLGIRMAGIGLIEGMAESTASLLKVISGWFSDKVGKRKRLAVLGYGISAVAKPFLLIVTSWWGVFAVRFAERVGKGVRTAPRDALIADSIDKDHRGLAFGLHRAGDTAGAVLGLVLAFGIVWASQAGALSLSRETFQRAVWLSIIPALLAVALLALTATTAFSSMALASEALPNSPALMAAVLNPLAIATRPTAMNFFNLTPPLWVNHHHKMRMAN